MSPSIRHDQTTREAKAVAATRAQDAPMVHVATLTTLILSVVLLGLLSGAAWMQLT